MDTTTIYSGAKYEVVIAIMPKEAKGISKPGRNFVSFAQFAFFLLFMSNSFIVINRQKSRLAQRKLHYLLFIKNTKEGLNEGL